MKKLVLIVCLFLSSCGYANIDEVKRNAGQTWKSVGFEIVGYEGYQWGSWYGGNYGGASVWYNLRRIPDNGITYTGYQWGSWYGGNYGGALVW